MADITKVSTASMDANSGMRSAYFSGLTAGSAIAVADACYIDSNGEVQPAIASTVSTGSLVAFVGLAPKAVADGSPITLFGLGARFSYGTELTPGTVLFVSAENAGALTATANDGDLPVAIVVSSTDIQVIR